MVRPRFERFVPSPTLGALVAAVDVQESEGPLGQAVLPETGLVLGFQFRGRLELETPTGPTLLAPHGVTGLQEGPRVFRTGGALGSVLVRLRPWAGGSLGVPASEVTGWSGGLDSLFPGVDFGALVQELAQGSDDQRLARVTAFLEDHLVHLKADLLTRSAVEFIDQRRGLVRVADLVDRLGTSHSPLVRRFHDHVGVGPKAYASLVRLRSLLPRLSNRDGALTDLAVELGFHDQAHFIAEFRRMTGLTPKQYQNKDRWTESLLRLE